MGVVDRGNDSHRATWPGPDLNWSAALAAGNRSLFVANPLKGVTKVIVYYTAGFSMMAMTAKAAEEASWGTVLLTDFPAGGRVAVDDRFPRRETYVEGGYAVSFPAGDRTLRLAFPGYVERTIPVTVGAGEILFVDGQMTPE